MENWMMRQFDNSTIRQFEDLNNGMMRLLPKFRFGGRKLEEWENWMMRQFDNFIIRQFNNLTI